ncbi:phosphate ABC transporter permease [Almyronema epifaneia]|uniref:Phosphate ABC transporter permease n=1 Tax=Almyronema epifaneia S1 TaxID=2991925 RepID=A0ABW6IDD9_9CYAN
MLVPLTREKFDELLPSMATGEQYRHYWGKLSDFLRRLLISVVAGVGVFIARLVLGEAFDPLTFTAGTIAGLYWLWSPVWQANRRNRWARRNSYSGFWRGRVLDVFVTDEVVSTEETVNNRGELVIVEDRERYLNLELGDKTGFRTPIQTVLKRDHRLIRRGDIAEMLVLSNREDLSRINMISDVYIPDHKLWVGDYPYLRRDTFLEVRQKLLPGRSAYRRPRPVEEPMYDYDDDYSIGRQ